MEAEDKAVKKSHVVIAVLIITTSVLTPILFPRLIACSTVFSDRRFTAGDILGYIGALFASIITILGLSWTFSDNRRGIKEQGRLDVLPFIGMNRLNKEYRLSAFANAMDVEADSQAIRREDRDLYYREHRLDSVFFIIEDEVV